MRLNVYYSCVLNVDLLNAYLGCSHSLCPAPMDRTEQLQRNLKRINCLRGLRKKQITKVHSEFLSFVFASYQSRSAL